MGIQGIKYGSGHERLEELLRSVDRPGNYCAGGRLFVPMPRVAVQGVGELSFPVLPTQIEALIDAAERAPFGKGTRTLVDTSVRDCWQIDARRVRLLGKAWPDSLGKVLGLVADGLGLPVESLRAEPYKLLVYRQGGFFSEHRDTEKAPGMVATLTLSLPTAGSGGELVVRHGDRETTFDLAAEEPSELSFAAFYSDCPHEVRPVTEGHRVSLVYNLSLDSGRPGLGAPDYADLAAPVAECLAKWRDEGSTDKIVWLLEHGYSEGGLSFDTLKNTDAAVAKVLAEAADRAACELHAAVLKIKEYGTPEIDAVYSPWGHYDDDDGADAEMEEVHDRWEALDGWAARDGSRPALGEVQLNDAELLPSGALAEAEPDDRWLEGSTGNEGPTLEFIYRLGALVIWPAEKAVDVVAGAGIDGAVAWAAARCSGSGDSESSLRILDRLVDLWPVEKKDVGEQDRGAMLRLLADVGAADVAVDFLHRAVMAKYDGSENEELAAVMPLIPADDGWEFLVGLVVEHFARRPGDVVGLLALTSGKPGLRQDGVWRVALRESTEIALARLAAALRRLGKKRAARTARRVAGILAWGSHEDRLNPPRERMGGEAVRDLFVLARRFDLEEEAAAAVGAIGKYPEIVTPDRMLPAALREMHRDDGLARSRPYAALWKQASDFLLERSSGVPEEPGGWAMTVEIPCDCEDCSRLRAFCRDPGKQVERFSVRKDRRKHLHRAIDAYELDVDHETERRGRPYTLVCTKNRDGQRRRFHEYAEDVQHMEYLLECAPDGPAGAAPDEIERRVERLRQAVAAGGAAG